MDINQTIDFNVRRIKNIEEIAPGHPVFRISFRPASNSIYVGENEAAFPDLVIKVESARQRRHVTDPIKIMNAIDPQAKTRQLKPMEIQALRRTVQNFNLPRLASDLDSATRPGQAIKPVIIVMKAKRNLIDLEAAGKRNNNDKTGVKAIRKILNQPAALEKLGKILAADAFNGNQDRVSFVGPSTITWDSGQSQVALQVIQNVGNFFFTADGHMSDVLGLDSVDPSNQFKDLDTFASAADGFEYPGKLLHDRAGRNRIAFVHNLITDIETILGERNRKIPFSSQKHLPSNAASQIVRGMENGAREIRHFLRTQYPPKPISAGLRSRLQALGWLTPQGSIRL